VREVQVGPEDGRHLRDVEELHRFLLLADFSQPEDAPEESEGELETRPQGLKQLHGIHGSGLVDGDLQLEFAGLIDNLFAQLQQHLIFGLVLDRPFTDLFGVLSHAFVGPLDAVLQKHAHHLEAALQIL
jgi:hypothetical protein